MNLHLIYKVKCNSMVYKPACHTESSHLPTKSIVLHINCGQSTLRDPNMRSAKKCFGSSHISFMCMRPHIHKAKPVQPANWPSITLTTDTLPTSSAHHKNHKLQLNNFLKTTSVHVIHAWVSLIYGHNQPERRYVGVTYLLMKPQAILWVDWAYWQPC